MSRAFIKIWCRKNLPEARTADVEGVKTKWSVSYDLSPCARFGRGEKKVSLLASEHRWGGGGGGFRQVEKVEGRGPLKKLWDGGQTLNEKGGRVLG